MPIEPVSMAAASERMSPNMLPVTMTSNCLGARTSCIAALSTYMWLSSTSGYSAATSSITSRHSTVTSSTLALSTEHRRPSRLRARAEGQAGDAADLRLAIDVGVEALALAIFQGANAPRLTEVDAAGELAHDQDVQPRHHFRLQAGGVRQLRIENRRAQVTEQLELGANAQQAPLRAQVSLHRVPLGTAHRAQQNGVRGPGRGQGFRRQRHPGGVYGGPAQQPVLELQVQAEAPVHDLQHFDRLGHDLRPDIITGQYQYFLSHRDTLPT